METCTNCGSKQLRWWITVHTNSMVADGRLKLNEVSPIAYLACEECSETLQTIHEDEINQLLNQEKYHANTTLQR